MGPGPVCLEMVRSSIDVPPARLLPTIKSGDDSWKTISTTAAMAYMSKVLIAWTEYHREYVGLFTLLELPSYTFDLKDYWSPYQKDLIAPVTSSQSARTPTVVPEKRRLLITCL